MPGHAGDGEAGYTEPRQEERDEDDDARARYDPVGHVQPADIQAESRRRAGRTLNLARRRPASGRLARSGAAGSRAWRHRSGGSLPSRCLAAECRPAVRAEVHVAADRRLTIWAHAIYLLRDHFLRSVEWFAGSRG